MDDFADLSHVIILVAMAGAFVLNWVLKPALKQMKQENETLEDAETYQDEEEVVFEEIQPLEEVRPIQKTTPKKHSSKKSHQKQSTTPPAPAGHEPTAHPSSPLRIRSKADARRAFLYSEIFNRKYE
jgi:DNA primase